jgi:WD40 repeat protein
LNLIATANGNNNVHLYNPYVQEANGILKGHMKSVIAVKFIAGGGRLVSFSKDKVLRIWNVNLQMGIYRIANIYPKGPEG